MVVFKWADLMNGLVWSGLPRSSSVAELEQILGSVWLGVQVGWDGPDYDSWDGTALFSVWLRRDGTNPFSVWTRDNKSGISY